VRVYAVNGDCMVSESVRAMGQNIAPGNLVAVDTGRMPRVGDVVVAWDGLNEVLLIKRYQEEGEHIVFYPARHRVPRWCATKTTWSRSSGWWYGVRAV